MFQIGFSVVQFLFALSSGFLVDLVFTITLVEIKATVVEDLRVVAVLVLHAFFQIHDWRFLRIKILFYDNLRALKLGLISYSSIYLQLGVMMASDRKRIDPVDLLVNEKGRLCER